MLLRLPPLRRSWIGAGCSGPVACIPRATPLQRHARTSHCGPPDAWHRARPRRLPHPRHRHGQQVGHLVRGERPVAHDANTCTLGRCSSPVSACATTSSALSRSSSMTNTSQPSSNVPSSRKRGCSPRSSRTGDDPPCAGRPTGRIARAPRHAPAGARRAAAPRPLAVCGFERDGLRSCDADRTRLCLEGRPSRRSR